MIESARLAVAHAYFYNADTECIILTLIDAWVK
jgi:hypothetical protein